MATKRKNTQKSATRNEAPSADDWARRHGEKLPSMFDGDVLAKHRRDRKREKVRGPRKRNPSGFFRGWRGLLFKKTDSTEAEHGPFRMRLAKEDRIRLAELFDLVDWMRRPSPRSLDDTTLPAIRNALASRELTEAELQRGAAGLADVEKVRRLRAAHAAAFTPLEERWQRRLRAAVKLRLQRGDRGRFGPRNATDVLALVGRGLPKRLVPEALTVPRIAKALRRATLGRGGGPGKKVNVDRAVDDLIREVMEQTASE